MNMNRIFYLLVIKQIPQEDIKNLSGGLYFIMCITDEGMSL